ncbi:hypothetical protein HYV22_02595 [Candidatus Gottesmanbacteria bacterium]|nr:hypothetical protein [Candidatus Gottesmanbacteria bacterium]
MAGCACEQSKGMYLSSYDDVVEQLKVSTPTLSEHEVRVQAAQTFRPRYHQDKISEKREAANLPEYEIGHFTLTDSGDVRYIEYGKTLEEMQQSQIRQRPDEYSPEEHQTSRMIQEAFRNGATVVSTVYARNDGEHRDILVMKYDPVTRIGTASIINTAIEGTYHSFTSVHMLSRQQFTSLAESKPAERVFILSDVKVEEQRGNEIVQEVQQIASEVSKTNPVKERGYWRQDTSSIPERDSIDRDTLMPQHVVLENTPQSQSVIMGFVKEGEETGRRVVKDTIATFSKVAEVVRDSPMNENKRSESQPVLVQGIEDSKRTKKTQNDSKQKNSMLIIEETQESQEEKYLPKQQHRRVKEYLRVAMQNKLTEVARVRASVILAAKVHSVSKTERRSFRELKKKLQEKKVHYLKGLNPVLGRYERIKRETRLFLRRKEKRQKKQQDQLSSVLVWLANKIAKKEKPIQVDKPTIQKPQKEITSERRLQICYHVLEHDNKSHMIRRLKKEKVLEFSFAWMLWILLQSLREEKVSFFTTIFQQHFDVSIHRSELTGEEKAKTTSLVEINNLRSMDRLVENEPTHWVLLAIIWYLAMIREGGMSNYPIKRQGQKRLVHTGVIFAYQPPVRAMMEIYG